MDRLVAWVLLGSVLGLGCGSGRPSDDDASAGHAASAANGGASGQMGGAPGTTFGGAAGAPRAQAGSESGAGSAGAAGASKGGSDSGAGAQTAGGETSSGGSAGGSHTSAGGDAGGGAMTAPLPCSLPVFSADFAYDWDVAVATVSGTVTLNGAVMPDSPGLSSRGSVWFHDRNFGSNYVFPVGASGSADFRGLLFSGQYDVNFGTVNDINLRAMPVNKFVRVATAVTIGGDTVLQLDARTVAASGTVTANGGTLPSSPLIGSRGSVTFRDESTGASYAFSINSTNTANFSATLFASSYAIVFSRRLTIAWSACPSTRPPGSLRACCWITTRAG